MKNIVCPISDKKVKRSVVRITGFLTALTIVLYFITGSPIIPAFLVVDFYIRAYTNYPYSVLSIIAKSISQLVDKNPIIIDRAPKVFAARVGLLFSLAILAFAFIHPTTSIVIATILMGFALLESLFNVCMGCIVYHHLVFPLYQSRHSQ